MNVITLSAFALALCTHAVHSETVTIQTPQAPTITGPSTPHHPLINTHQPPKSNGGLNSGILGSYILDRFYNQPPAAPMPESSVKFTSKPRVPEYDK